MSEKTKRRGRTSEPRSGRGRQQHDVQRASGARRGSRKRVPGESSSLSTGPQRLQKVLAAAGFGSRRECEQLIVAGRVDVDGQTVTELGTKVDPQIHQIRVDGQRVTHPKRVYYMVNKPPGVVSTMRDPAGRQRVVDLVPSEKTRIYNVGRLDKSSEGLILLTNDGELANRLTHPRYGVEKTYRVLVAGVPKATDLARLRRGVHLAEGVAKVVRVKIVSRYKESTVLEIVLNEGRNREIRRLLARLGHKVLRLKRVAIDGVRLGNMPVGACRPLRRDEVRRLYQAASATDDTLRSPRQGKRSAAGGRSRSQSARAAGRASRNRH